VLQIFLSYARIDGEMAGRLRRVLSRSANAHVWFDQHDIVSGLKWKPAIRKAIRESSYFVAVVSKRSVSSRGFRDKEVAEALEVLKEFPESEVFLIPTRLDDCEMPKQAMKRYTSADLFPDWGAGVAKLRTAMGLKPAMGKARSVASKSIASTVERRMTYYRVSLVDMAGGVPSIRVLARELNRIQDFFGFGATRVVAPTRARTILDDSPHLDVERLPELFFKRVCPLSSDYAICLTDRLLTYVDDEGTPWVNHLTSKSRSHDRALFISHGDLGIYSAQAGVSFDVALAFLIVGELVDFFLDTGYHDDIRDCPMDYTQDHALIVPGLRAGRFCKSCDRKLSKNPNLKKALTAMLKWRR